MENSRSPIRQAALALAALAIAGTAQADAACLKPTLVTAEQRSETSLLVTWKAPPGLRGRATYRVSRAGHVVGQTRRRSMTVAVRPGRWAVIRIGVVRSGAGRMRCAAVLKARTQPPARADLGAPRDFGVRELSDVKLRLSWDRVGAAFAYRVFRDEAVVKQVRATSFELPVVAGRPYRLQVAPVDRAGRLGAMSRTILISTEISPPKPPTGLGVAGAGAGSYRVTWNHAARGTRPLRAYRVLRNGVVLGQTPTPGYTVTGLQAGETYRIEVQSVDSAGQLSPRSAPLDISLDPPTPTAGHARAFLLASTDRSFEDFQANYMRIGKIYPTYFDCTADGVITGRDDPRITRWAQARRVEVIPRVNCQRTATLHRILTEPAMRSRWMGGIVQLTRDNGYQGINLDFEAGLWTDRAAMSSFVAELAGRLHAEGRSMSICVSSKVNDRNPQHPRNGIFDYPSISASVDEVLLMAWGWHWVSSGAGEISPLSWLQGVASYASSMPHADRFVMGTAMYGIDWPAGSGVSNPGTALEYVDVLDLVARLRVTPQRDPASGELYFSYTDGRGVHHDVRYLDSTSVSIKHQAAASGGITRTFMWRLGDEDQTVWNLGSMGVAGD